MVDSKLTQTERKNISQPSEWWREFEATANQRGKSLSEWMGDCCRSCLPQNKQKKLPERILRGRPSEPA